MDWNTRLFLLLNAPASAGPLGVEAARLVATGLVPVMPVLLAALWIWGRAIDRAALIAVAIAAGAAVGLNQVLGLLWFEPRPFMLHLGHQLLAHVPDNSFPSDHATVMWTTGLGLIATGAARRWGTLVAVLGLAVAWARIYLGVHFPVDMMAPLPVSLLGAGVAGAIAPPLRRWLLPTVETLYETVLDALRLPVALFPRRAR